MTIYMYEIMCVTNRHLCKKDFLWRVEEIAKSQSCSMILREKDLSEKEYKQLAKRVLSICQKYSASCILHTFVNTAMELNVDKIHVPMSVLRELSPERKSYFSVIGASCHSVEEAVEAEHLGCTYITAGHIFETDCKKGLLPRGLGFLKEVCESVTIPVFAIGGMDSENITSVYEVGAEGICIMSGLMSCENVKNYISLLTK